MKPDLTEQTDTGRSARAVALGGMLFALCIALSTAESSLVGWVGLPPGVKPGIANVTVMYNLFF